MRNTLKLGFRVANIPMSRNPSRPTLPAELRQPSSSSAAACTKLPEDELGALSAGVARWCAPGALPIGIRGLVDRRPGAPRPCERRGMKRRSGCESAPHAGSARWSFWGSALRPEFGAELDGISAGRSRRKAGERGCRSVAANFQPKLGECPAMGCCGAIQNRGGGRSGCRAVSLILALYGQPHSGRLRRQRAREIGSALRRRNAEAAIAGCRHLARSRTARCWIRPRCQSTRRGASR